MSILLFFIILVVLIVSHEFGHFIVAKFAGIRVDEFGLGFPPRIAGIRKGDTLYSINWLPFGGFVRIYGEDGVEIVETSALQAHSFAHKPKWVQAAVIAAGVSFNLLLAWVLISVGLVSGFPTPVAGAPSGAAIEDVRLLVTSVEPESPAGRVGLKTGDSLVFLATAIDVLQGTPLQPEGVQDFIARHGAESITIGYRRGDGEPRTVNAIPETGIFGDSPAIGISMDVIGIATLPIHRALIEGVRVTGSLTLGTARALGVFAKGIFTGDSSFSSITGPVGIIGIVGDASEIGFIYLLGLTALISINLAIINLVPFPALDGGRLLFLVAEKLKGSPINPRTVAGLNTAGFVALLFFMAVITYLDILKL
ncbi:MAG: site-2 protease family protein [Candidatus Vogelbacteria bacterium]|nr:site-2 protease family protein [Candidatus Vogelbacteria bacterium]